MYKKNYKVKGYDVNDVMVMQDVAYYLYSINALHAFFFEIGYSKKRIAALDVNLEPIWQKLERRNTLLFTQEFSIYLEFTSLDEKGVLQIRCRFFNANNELCASTNSCFYLKKSFCNLICKEISLPKMNISQNTIVPGML